MNKLKDVRDLGGRDFNSDCNIGGLFFKKGLQMQD